MNEKENGGSAFPIQVNVVDDEVAVYHKGMTLRDYFAAKAMQGIIMDQRREEDDYMLYARDAYLIADSMLKAREEK